MTRSVNRFGAAPLWRGVAAWTNMTDVTHRRTRLSALVLVAALAGSSAACSRPDPNAPIKLTGDPSAVAPATTTTTTSTTSTTTTTLFYK